jgi:hypothetical protein
MLIAVSNSWRSARAAALATTAIENESIFGAHLIGLAGSMPQTLGLTDLENASVFGSPSIVSEAGSQTLTQTRFDNASTFGAPSITNPAADISVTTIGVGIANATTAAITVPAGGVPAGSLIVLGVSCEYTPGLASVTDTAGNTYARAVNSNRSYTPMTEIWYCKNCLALSAGDTIVSHIATAVRQRISALYAANADTADPLDAAACASARATSSTPSVTSGALAGAKELIVAILGTTSSRVITQDVDFAAPPDEQNTLGTYSIFGGHRIAADTTAQTYNPAMSNSQAWSECIAAFKPA